MSPTIRASLALAAMALAAPAGAASFDFSVAGFRVGELSLDIEQSGTSYAAAARIDTAGVVGVFADFFFDGQASGRLSGGKVVPELFTATSKSPRALRKSRIEWENGVPVEASVEPPRDSAPDPADQGGTLDPVSASVRLLRDAPVGEICNTTVDVYDGSRRSRLQLSRPVERGDELVCSGAYARLQGEGHSLTSRREFPFSLVFTRAGGGMATLERIEAPTNFGQAVVSRMD